MQGEDYKKNIGNGQRAAANAWGDHDTRSKSQSCGNLGNGGKGKQWLYTRWLVDKNKEDNYVVISL